MRKVIVAIVTSLVLLACEPDPTETPTVAPVEPSIEDIIRGEFADDWDGGDGAVRVAVCESTLDPDAQNGRYKGLFQIGSMHADYWEMVNGVGYWESWNWPDLNARFARALRDSSGGWGPWSCKP